MTAKQLKNSILKEAVQGKLVSQNNEDEPSSELLKRIKSERDKLINSNNNVASVHFVNIQKKASKGSKPIVLCKIDFCNSKTRQIFTNKSLSFEKLKKFKLLCSRFAVRGSRFAVNCKILLSMFNIIMVELYDI